MDLKFYLSLFVRRLPYFLLVAITVTAIGFTVANVLPPVYVAEARLLVESEQIPDELAASTVRTEATEQLQIIESRIMTRANLLELASRLRIYAGQPTLPADDLVEDMRERTTIERIGGPSITSRNAEGATLVRVACEAPTAAMSAQVTNEFVTLILRENVSMRTTVAGQTLEFFRQEVERLDQELALRRSRILEFQQENQEALPDSLEFRRSQQAAAQERLLQLDRDEATLKDRRARLVDLYERTGRVSVSPEQRTPMQRRLQAARDELSSALSLYSPSHPRVKVLESQVASLEAQAASGGASTAASDPGLSAYDVQLSDIDGQMAFIADQRGRLEAALETLSQTIAATPRNASQLETLQRDHANLRIQYDQAVASRARAETGDLIEALSKGERISVIEQAVAPRQPTSPNRPLIAAGGLGGGIALGLGLVVLLEMMNRSIRRPMEITQRLGVTPFATIPYIRTRREARRRSAIIGGALVLALVGVPAAIWAVDTYFLPIDLLIDQASRRLGLASLS